MATAPQLKPSRNAAATTATLVVVIAKPLRRINLTPNTAAPPRPPAVRNRCQQQAPAACCSLLLLSPCRRVGQQPVQRPKIHANGSAPSPLSLRTRRALLAPCHARAASRHKARARGREVQA